MATKLIKARVLVEFSHNGIACHPNQVVELDSALVKSLNGQVDADPGAVKYCLDNGASVIKLPE